MMVELQRILVPLDGSPLAERALPLALSLAHHYNSHLWLLSVTDILSTSQFVTYPEALQLMQTARNEACLVSNRYLQEKQKELQQEEVDIHILVVEGSPAEAIIDAATEQSIDLIVMSSHGRGGLERWSFGSVSDKVVRHSPCPVLVVRQGASAAPAA